MANKNNMLPLKSKIQQLLSLVRSLSLSLLSLSPSLLPPSLCSHSLSVSLCLCLSHSVSVSLSISAPLSLVSYYTQLYSNSLSGSRWYHFYFNWCNCYCYSSWIILCDATQMRGYSEPFLRLIRASLFHSRQSEWSIVLLAPETLTHSLGSKMSLNAISITRFSLPLTN